MAFYGTNAAVAWVNTTGTGTIRDSFNVTSVTRNGEGDISVNFTNNITDNDYVVTGWTDNWEGSNSDSGGIVTGESNNCMATDGVRVVTLRARFDQHPPQRQNFGNICISIFR